MNKIILINLIWLLPLLAKANVVDPKTAYADAVNDQAIIIDVRDAVQEGWEIAQPAYWTRFPASTQGLPALLNEFSNCLPRHKKIYFYCYAGHWAGYFAEKMQAQGLQAFSIGGFDLWQSAHLPTQTATANPNSLHCPSLKGLN